MIRRSCGVSIEDNPAHRKHNEDHTRNTTFLNQWLYNEEKILPFHNENGFTSTYKYQNFSDYVLNMHSILLHQLCLNKAIKNTIAIFPSM